MSDHPTALGGTCSARFDPLRELFAAKLESGEDLGASLVFNIDGEMVVDLWGGWADEARTVPWTENTITNVFSTTKAMTSLAALVLVDRGELDLDATVAKLLARVRGPGQGGDQGSPSPVAHLGRLGLGPADHPRGPVRLGQVDRPAGRAAPWWEPGTASGYHALNYGHLIGEVIRRITGQRLGEFFAAHIAGPLGADFHIGLPPSEFHRVANVVPPPAAPVPAEPMQLDPNSVAFKSMTNPAMSAETTWTEGWRCADIGAANGHGNARSLACLQSAVACGGEVDGVRLLSPHDDRTDLRSANQRDRPRDRHPDQVGRRLWPVPGRPGVFLGRLWRLVGGYRRGSPHDLRLRDEQDGAGRRDHRSGAGRAGERHRE